MNTPLIHNANLSTTSWIVGIVNLTPDSFSKDGLNQNTNLAIEQIRSFNNDGSTIIDIGAESTNPKSQPLTHQQEWQRLEPVLKELKQDKELLSKCTISLDSRHPDTVKKALDTGIVNWINDVSGFTNPKMIDIALQYPDTRLVMMHSLTVPASSNETLPDDEDPILYLLEWGEERIASLEQAGISKERIIFDPGIGFGKSPEHAWQILTHIRSFHDLELPILVGHSEKSFLKTITSSPAGERTIETCTITAHLAKCGVQFIRVHDVANNVRALRCSAMLNPT